MRWTLLLLEVYLLLVVNLLLVIKNRIGALPSGLPVQSVFKSEVFAFKMDAPSLWQNLSQDEGNRSDSCCSLQRSILPWAECIPDEARTLIFSNTQPRAHRSWVSLVLWSLGTIISDLVSRGDLKPFGNLDHSSYSINIKYETGTQITYVLTVRSESISDINSDLEYLHCSCFLFMMIIYSTSLWSGRRLGARAG